MDQNKIERITTIQEKQKSDAEILSWLQGQVRTTQARMNRRDRCMTILSGSLGTIKMIDYETEMKWNTGNILQATFK